MAPATFDAWTAECSGAQQGAKAIRAIRVVVPGTRRNVALDAPATRLKPAQRSDAVAARLSSRNYSVMGAMRSLLWRTRSLPEFKPPENAPCAEDSRGSCLDGSRTSRRGQVPLPRSTSDPEPPLSLETGEAGASCPAAGLDDPQLVSPTRGKAVKSLRVMMREARLQQLQDALDQEAEARTASSPDSGQLVSPTRGKAVKSLRMMMREARLQEALDPGQEAEDASAAEEAATGTEMHHNTMLAEALADDKSKLSKDEGLADRSEFSKAYSRPAAPIGLTRQQQRSLRSLAGCPSPQLPKPVLRALARTARSPAQSRGFERLVSSTHGPDVVDFSREASIAAKMSLAPPVLDTPSHLYTPSDIPPC